MYSSRNKSIVNSFLSISSWGSNPSCIFWAAEGIRTPDPRFTKALLYRWATAASPYFFPFDFLSNSCAFFLIMCNDWSILFSAFKVQIFTKESILCSNICFSNKWKWCAFILLSRSAIILCFLNPTDPCWGNFIKTGIFRPKIKAIPIADITKMIRAISWIIGVNLKFEIYNLKSKREWLNGWIWKRDVGFQSFQIHVLFKLISNFKL